ncbi:MAG: T9SS type A sorting domain-containing protein [Muribaculaceae bacterium]|nr:T9SS type A sorting domain-containing protein [Muribaculaceae bacterium]
MKKSTIIAVAALTSVAAAGAQDYQCDPSNAPIIEKNVKQVAYIVLSDRAVAQFEAKGASVMYIGPDGSTPSDPRPLYYWSGIKAGDESMPRVDMDEGGYISQEVLGTGWSGAGIAVIQPLDLSMIDNDTRFHMAYMTPNGKAPESVMFVLLDKPENGSTPGKFAIGSNYNDSGVIIPSMGQITEDWQGLDFSVGDLRKLWPAFNPNHLDSWTGNLMSWLAGNDAGTSFAIDACYFYNLGDGSGITDIKGDNGGIVVSGHTASVCGGTGIELYDMSGRLVRRSAGSVIGLDDLARGIYVARSGRSSEKIVIR